MLLAQDMKNRATCRECDQGTYQPATGRSSCVACPTGWTTAGMGTKTVCDRCIEDEYFWNATRRNCTYRYLFLFFISWKNQRFHWLGVQGIHE